MWWGNCAWCSLGIAALLKDDVSITTSLGAHGEQVIIHIKGGEVQEKDLYIDCDVQMYRLSLPERNIRSSAHAYDLFSASGPALQNMQITPEQKADMEWIDLGKDSQLAIEILKRIAQQIATEQTASKKI